MTNWDVSARAAQVHADALVWDNHGCVTLDLDNRYMPDLRRFRDSGVDMLVLNVGFDAYPWQRTVLRLAHLRHWVLTHPQDYVLALGVDEILRARQQGKLAIGFDIEGTVAIEEDLSLIRMFYDLGVRWMSIAYNLTNRVGGGIHDEDPGLTDFGRRVLDEMESVGMLVCCSHTGHRTCRDVFGYSRNPVLFTHSNPSALKEHPRNIPDDLMKACADSGGVVGINGIGIFLGDLQTRTESMVRHIDYAVQLIGADHVGIGLDYTIDPSLCVIDLTTVSSFYPPGCEYEDGVTLGQPEQLPEVTEGLLKLGYRDQEVRAVVGENLLRIARQVWK